MSQAPVKVFVGEKKPSKKSATKPARKPRKPAKPSKAAVKAAAARAEARSKGEDIDEPKVEIDPPIEKTSVGGRPTEYRPEYCKIAAEMALAGSTDEEIASALGVNASTIWRWKGRHEAFCKALQWGKDNCDERVERSLYARAVGYTYDAVKIFQYEGSPVIVSHKEHVPPDVGAAKHWLSNRKRNEWADVTRQEISGPGGAPIEVADVSKLDLARWIAATLMQTQAPKRLDVEDVASSD